MSPAAGTVPSESWGHGTWVCKAKPPEMLLNPASLFYQQACHSWHWSTVSHFPRQPQGLVCCISFLAASLLLLLVFLFSSSAPVSPIFGSPLHSCTHSSVRPCLSLAATVWGGNCTPVFCERAVSLVPVGVSVLTATAGLYIWRGVGAAALEGSSYTHKKRRGNDGCTGELCLCCWFRVGRGVRVVQ